jgi:hypothetical protein
MSWLDDFDSRLSEVLAKYSPDQPRDENGQFASVDGGSGSSEKTSSWTELNQTAWDNAGHLTRSDLTENEINALTSYTQDGYIAMNSTLRYGNSPEEDTQKSIDNLTNLINNNSRLPEDTLLYRGLTNRAGHWDSLQVGDRFVDKSFVSTSPTFRGARDFGSKIMEIEAPAGTPALDTYTALNGGVRESEVILQAGTEYEVMANEKGGTLRLRVVNE